MPEGRLPTLEEAEEYGISYHGVAATHLDALCHVWNENGMMLTIAPLRVAGGTGSPVNPLALF